MPVEICSGSMGQFTTTGVYREKAALELERELLEHLEKIRREPDEGINRNHAVSHQQAQPPVTPGWDRESAAL